jgi:hypothetical protein
VNNSTVALLLFIGIIILLLAGIVYAIASKNGTKGSGSFASMAAFHDMQGKDKQNAIETVIEQQAEKKWEEQESGQGGRSARALPARKAADRIRPNGTSAPRP